MNNIAVDYVYTFRDAFSASNVTMPLSVFGMNESQMTSKLISLFENNFDTEIYAESEYISENYFRTLMYEGILSQFLDTPIGSITRYFPYYVTEEEEDANAPTATEIREKVTAPFLNAILTTYALTRKKYITIIDTLTALQSDEDGLLKRPGSSSVTTSKYSDTPQDTDNEDTLEGDAHLTNVARNENNIESDGASPIARYDEIASKIRNAYREWAREFEPLFMHARGAR